tara:strand:+ start:136 stop:609 length:474 start_codon:yes stop_codon:yes gene_type:complete
MSILKVDTINEKTSGNGVLIPGHVVQVIQGSTNTEVSGDTTTYTDTTLSATITPKSASSKIFIKVNQHCRWDRYGLSIRVLRGSTAIQEPAQKFTLYSADVNDDLRMFYINEILDTPSTTSAVTYKTQYASNVSSGASIRLNGNGFYSYLTLMEIAQ